MLTVSQNISEHHEMSQAPQRERDLIDGILANAPVGILVKSLLPETHGRCLVWNRAMDQMFKQPAEAVIGNTSVDVFDPVLASVFSEQDLWASLGGHIMAVYNCGVRCRGLGLEPEDPRSLSLAANI